MIKRLAICSMRLKALCAYHALLGLNQATDFAGGHDIRPTCVIPAGHLGGWQNEVLIGGLIELMNQNLTISLVISLSFLAPHMYMVSDSSLFSFSSRQQIPSSPPPK